MNDFLLELGYSNDLVNEIVRFNGENTYVNLCFNEEDVTSVINYLKEIGIRCISELLIYRIDIFLEDIDKIGNSLNNNTKEIIDLINDDFTNIDLLFKD